MAPDAQSEFERIFGKTQGSDSKPAEDSPRTGVTQKLPSDSDLLGIRTDSDRFIVKNVPETLPGATKPLSEDAVKSVQEAEAAKTSQDAMTIALNVNVFANIADPKKPSDAGSGKEKSQFTATLSELLGKKAGETPGGSADGPTFVIPLPKENKAAADRPPSPVPASASSAADEFTRVINPKNIPANPNPNTEFTRVLHVEDSVKLPKPNFPPAGDDISSASTIAVTSDPKLPRSAPPEPAIGKKSGPSDFTKVVKGSELRALQEKLAAAAGKQAGTPQQWHPPAQYPTPGAAQPWQSGSAPVPHYVPTPAQQSWPPANPSPAMPPQTTPQHSKLSQYMPIIIVLNLLVLMAILLIVFFAIKK